MRIAVVWSTSLSSLDQFPVPIYDRNVIVHFLIGRLFPLTFVHPLYACMVSLSGLVRCSVRTRWCYDGLGTCHVMLLKEVCPEKRAHWQTPWGGGRHFCRAPPALGLWGWLSLSGSFPPFCFGETGHAANMSVPFRISKLNMDCAFCVGALLLGGLRWLAESTWPGYLASNLVKLHTVLQTHSDTR